MSSRDSIKATGFTNLALKWDNTPILHQKSNRFGARKMISAEYCRLLARYNTWQNASLVTAADGLTDADRWKDRGAFFQSIAATLNHLYWADALMLQRLEGNERPQDTVKHSLTDPSDWDDFKALRLKRDEEVESWAGKLNDTDLDGVIAWYPPGSTTRIVKPKALCAVGLFNHQTHHRGQVHAMLTGSGCEAGADRSSNFGVAYKFGLARPSTASQQFFI